MTDDELLERFTRLVEAPDRIDIEVATVAWAGPHTPVTTWHVALRLDPTACQVDIVAARRGVLSNRKFFRVCQRCRERQPLGWMGTQRSCHSCMTRHDGVVF